MSGNKKFALGCIGFVLFTVLSCTTLALGGYLINKAIDKAEVVNTSPAVVQQVPNNPANPIIVNPASQCEARAKDIGAPTDMVKAICNAKPSGLGVSGRLPVGSEVSIGSITFDNEDRVWFLEGFTTPAMANYAFSYEGSEQSLFDAPFVIGTELGYGKNGTRVPFKICWDVTSDGCIPPTALFPTK